MAATPNTLSNPENLHLSRDITSVSSADEQRLRLQLLGHLGVTQYHLQNPGVLSHDMIAAFDLEPDSAPVKSEAPQSEALKSEPLQSKALKLEPTQPGQTEAKKAASTTASSTSTQSAQTRNIDNMRAMLNSDSQSSDNQAENQVNQPETPTHRVKPDNQAILDTTDKLAVEKSLHTNLPNWFWQDLLLLLNVSAEQVILFEPGQSLSHTRQARFVIRKALHSALYASNILGVDESLLAELSANEASNTHQLAKQQLWQLLRVVFVE